MPHDEKAKRRKTFPSTDSDSGDSDDEAAFQKFLKGQGQGKLKSSNDSWNACHLELRKTLEQAGTLDRYGIKHLSLWTDLIRDGTVSGCHEEPDWTKYLHVVHVAPLPKRGLGFTRAREPNDVLTNFLLHREEERQWERQQQSSLHALLLSALSPTVRPLTNDGASASSPATQCSKEGTEGNQGQCTEQSLQPTRRQIKYNTWSPPSFSSSSPESIKDSPANSNSPIIVSSDTTESDGSEPFDFDEWVNDQIAMCRRIQSS